VLSPTSDYVYITPVLEVVGSIELSDSCGPIDRAMALSPLVKPSRMTRPVRREQRLLLAAGSAKNVFAGFTSQNVFTSEQLCPVRTASSVGAYMFLLDQIDLAIKALPV
jgi:hypothetical protein